jgi:hypothetical protein
MTEGAADEAGQDASRLHGERIERLLDAVEAAAGPAALPRVEALLAAIVDLYGVGLERILAAARVEARDPRALDERWAADELVSSVLLLHGLHPIELKERVDLALDRARSALPALADLELVDVEDGVINLRIGSGTAASAAISAQVAAAAVARAAPEATSVRIEGLTPAPPADVVPIERLRRGGRR